MKISISPVLASLLLLASSVSSLSLNNNNQASSRRAWLAGSASAMGIAGIAASAGAAPLGAGTPVGQEIDTFLSLIYNFKNTDLTGGLDASTLKEESIPFVEFGEKMKDGQVTFVEFMAPSGDVAYATIKGSTTPIRIGQGYPINKKGSWSSPDYVIRSVSNFQVPYKFTVPGLAKFSKGLAKVSK
jgi:hypothetical protein